MEQRDSPKKDVSVVFPTYNERDNIGPLIREVLKHTPPNTEVIVVDDDSPDGTWKIVEEMQRDLPNLRLLHRTTERGLTSALRAGIAAAAGDVVVWSDCDFSMPPAKVEDCWANSPRVTTSPSAVGSSRAAESGSSTGRATL